MKKTTNKLHIYLVLALLTISTTFINCVHGKHHKHETDCKTGDCAKQIDDVKTKTHSEHKEYHIKHSTNDPNIVKNQTSDDNNTLEKDQLYDPDSFYSSKNTTTDLPLLDTDETMGNDRLASALTDDKDENDDMLDDSKETEGGKVGRKNDSVKVNKFNQSQNINASSPGEAKDKLSLNQLDKILLKNRNVTNATRKLSINNKTDSHEIIKNKTKKVDDSKFKENVDKLLDNIARYNKNKKEKRLEENKKMESDIKGGLDSVKNSNDEIQSKKLIKVKNTTTTHQKESMENSPTDEDEDENQSEDLTDSESSDESSDEDMDNNIRLKNNKYNIVNKNNTKESKEIKKTIDTEEEPKDKSKYKKDSSLKKHIKHPQKSNKKKTKVVEIETENSNDKNKKENKNTEHKNSDKKKKVLGLNDKSNNKDKKIKLKNNKEEKNATKQVSKAVNEEMNTTKKINKTVNKEMNTTKKINKTVNNENNKTKKIHKTVNKEKKNTTKKINKTVNEENKNTTKKINKSSTEIKDTTKKINETVTEKYNTTKKINGTVTEKPININNTVNQTSKTENTTLSQANNTQEEPYTKQLLEKLYKKVEEKNKENEKQHQQKLHTSIQRYMKRKENEKKLYVENLKANKKLNASLEKLKNILSNPEPSKDIVKMEENSTDFKINAMLVAAIDHLDKQLEIEQEHLMFLGNGSFINNNMKTRLLENSKSNDTSNLIEPEPLNLSKLALMQNQPAITLTNTNNGINKNIIGSSNSIDDGTSDLSGIVSSSNVEGKTQLIQPKSSKLSSLIQKQPTSTLTNTNSAINKDIGSNGIGDGTNGISSITGSSNVDGKTQLIQPKPSNLPSLIQKQPVSTLTNGDSAITKKTIESGPISSFSGITSNGNANSKTTLVQPKSSNLSSLIQNQPVSTLTKTNNAINKNNLGSNGISDATGGLSGISSSSSGGSSKLSLIQKQSASNLTNTNNAINRNNIGSSSSMSNNIPTNKNNTSKDETSAKNMQGSNINGINFDNKKSPNITLDIDIKSKNGTTTKPPPSTSIIIVEDKKGKQKTLNVIKKIGMNSTVTKNTPKTNTPNTPKTILIE